MKQKVLNNIGLKIISVLAAVIIWMLIVNVDDAVITRTFTVNVQEKNASDLESIGKTYEVVSGQSATFKVKGRTSVVSRLEAGNFKATADLSKLSATGAVWVDIVGDDKVRNCEIVSNNNVYVVATENLVSKQFPVSVQTRGEVANGYCLGQISVTPNMINISGSETKISNIKELQVMVDVGGYSSNISMKNLQPQVIGLNGVEMDMERLKLDTTSVDVSITMLRTKSVPVKISFVGEPKAGYVAVSKDSTEATVALAGLKEDLDKISVLNMTCDISGADANIERTVLYKDFLPEGVTLADNDPEIAGVPVKVVIEPIIEKEITLDPASIALQNASSEYNYAWDGSAVVKAKAAKSVLDNLPETAIRLRADVANFREGSYYVLVKVICEKGIEVEEPLYMTIRITRADVDNADEADAGADEAVSMMN